MRYRMTLLVTVAVATFALSRVPALAAGNVQNLIQSNGCSSCHSASTKLVGPPWGWVAYRYQGKKHAVESVAKFIIDGGVGYWQPWTGAIPMPSHPDLSKAQAKEIAKWVLAQPPIKPPARN